MRTILALLMASLLLATPLALAEADERARARESNARADEARAGAQAERADAAAERAAERGAERTERQAAREGWVQNHTQVVERFVARVKAIQASWHENTTKLREECRQLAGENATKEDRSLVKECIRDGHAKWRAERRAEMTAARAEFRALLEGWREARPLRHAE